MNPALGPGDAGFLVSGGLLATTIVTAGAYLGPLIGLPMIDLAACFANVFSGIANGGAREWWAGLMIHFGLGAIGLPVVFRFGFRRFLRLEPQAAGVVFGFLVFVFFGAGIFPFSGQGVFGLSGPDPLLTIIALLLGGLVYGVALASFAVRGVREEAFSDQVAQDRSAA